MKWDNKLIKNGIYYTIGGFLVQGINFFTIPIFTRLLNPEDYGIISIYTTWMGIFSIFIALQTHGSIGNAKNKYSEEEFQEYLSNIIILSLGTFFFFLFSFYLFRSDISRIIGLSTNIVLLMIIQSFFNLGITFRVTLDIFYSRPKQKLFISLISTLLNVGLSIYFITNISSFDKYMGRIFGGFIPTLVLGAYFFLSIVLKKKPTFRKEHWKFCLSISIPLIFHNLSHLVLNSSDRIMLEKFVGMEATGIYSFTYNIGMIVNVLWGAFNSAWVPWFYENMKNDRRELIVQYSKYYLYFFTFLCMGFIIISPELVKIMAPKYYWSGLQILPWIIIGSYFIFYYSFPVNYEFYHKKTNYIAIGTTLSALSNVGLNFYFIPKYGALGAALTTFISYVFLFVFHEIIVRKKMRDKIVQLEDYGFGIIAILVTTGVYYIFMENIFARYAYMMIIIFIAITKLKNKVLKIRRIKNVK